VRFSTGVHAGGCKNQKHTFTYLQPDSREYYFLNKHYDVLKEPFYHSSSPNETNENKSTTDITEEEAKTPQVRPKMMSLLTLVKEFSSSKYLKLRNNN